MRQRAYVRWREDTGYELLCVECEKRGVQCFWPLTEEFWSRHTFLRCRSCDKRKRAESIARRRREDPEYYRRSLAEVAANKRLKGHIYRENAA